jgi:hypothetical protein
VIPFATTTVTVTRPARPVGVRDPWSTPPAEPEVVAAAVRAVIGRPTGAEVRTETTEVVTRALVLTCDPVPDLDGTCTVTDDLTSVVYAVGSVDHFTGLGLDHTQAELTTTTGVSS